MRHFKLAVTRMTRMKSRSLVLWERVALTMVTNSCVSYVSVPKAVTQAGRTFR
jgi:hypothetical protein